MKIVAKCIAVFLGFLLLIVAIFPMLLSEPNFQKHSLNILNHYMPGTIDAKRLHLSWFSGQRIDGLEFKSRHNDYYFSAQELTTETPLWKLLFFKTINNNTQISSLNGWWKPSTYDDHLIVVNDMDGQLLFPHSKDVGLAEFTGKTKFEGNTGNFAIQIQGIQWPISLNNKNGLIIQAKLVNFPTQIFDTVMALKDSSWKNIFRELLGENLNLNISQSFLDDGSLINLKGIASNNFKIDLQSHIIPEKHIMINGDIESVITPQLVSSVSPQTKIKNESILKAHIEKGLLPWQLFKNSKNAFPFELIATVNISEIVFDALQFNNLNLNIHALPENEKANIQLMGTLIRPNEKTNFSLGFLAEKPHCFYEVASCEVPHEIIASLESKQVSIPELRINLHDKLLWKDVYKMNSFGADVIANQVRLRDKNLANEITLKNVYVPFEYVTKGKQNNFAFQLNAGSNGQKIIESKGAIHLPGIFNWRDMTFIFDGKCNKCPIGQFVSLVDPEISSLLEFAIGYAIDGHVQFELREGEGPINIHLQGDQGFVTLKGNIYDNELNFTHPFIIQSLFSPQLMPNSLKKRYPFLGVLTAVENPLKITLQPKSLSIPLDPFDPYHLNIGDGTIELGKIKVKNRGQIRDLLNMFQANTQGDISLWFTPLYFKIENGIINILRTDMLLSSYYPIATWGKIDLVKNKVGMIVGISGIALSNTLGISLNDHYMLQLSLKGNIQQPKLEKEKAAMQLGALLAQSKGTTEGLIIGTLLDLANGKLKEGKVPEPTTKPFPWGDVEKTKKSIVNDEQSKSQSDNSIIKHVEKQANSIIDKLLN